MDQSIDAALVGNDSKNSLSNTAEFTCFKALMIKDLSHAFNSFNQYLVKTPSSGLTRNDNLCMLNLLKCKEGPTPVDVSEQGYVTSFYLFFLTFYRALT